MPTFLFLWKKCNITVYSGEQGAFTPTLSGGTAGAEETIGWSSNNTSVIATPSNSEGGTAVNFTPSSATNTTVRLTGTVVSPGYATSYIDITVKPARTLSSIAVKTAPTKVTYDAGSTFDPTGLVITLTYDDTSTVDVAYADASASFTFSPSTSTALTTSDTSVTISYGGKSTTQAITVLQVATYSVTARDAVSTSGSAPTSSSMTYYNTYSSSIGQMTQDNTSTWTLSGYSGKTITSIVAYCRKSNSASGSITTATNDGDSVLTDLDKTSFSSSDLSSSFEPFDVLKTTSDPIDVKGDFVLVFKAAANSFYVNRLDIKWEDSDLLNEDLTIDDSSATKSFTIGDNFAFGGTATASYSSTGSKDVTSNVTFQLGSTDIAIGDTITAAMLDSETVTSEVIEVAVWYTDAKGNSAAGAYNVTVSYSAVTSVSISTSASEMAKDGKFTFGATVLPATANQNVTWSASSSDLTEGDDFIINSTTGYLDVDASTGGTIRVTATTVGKDSSSASKTAYVDVTITGDPVVTVSSTISGYSGKNTNLAYSFSNFTGTLSVVSSDTNKVTVGTPSETTGGSGSGTVQVNFVAAGSSTLSFKDGDSVIATCTVTVNASAVESVGWIDSSNMTVYSGSTALNAAKIASWGPYYEMNNGDSDDIESDYTVQLNGSAYTLGTALEAGIYTVTLTYGGKTTASSNPVVTVIQSLNTINSISENSKSWSDDGSTNPFDGSSGTTTLDGVTWSFTRTNTATTHAGFTGSRYIQFGSKAAGGENVELRTSNIDGVITSISVLCATGSETHTVSISVGGKSYLSQTAPA